MVFWGEIGGGIIFFGVVVDVGYDFSNGYDVGDLLVYVVEGGRVF